MIVRKPQKNVPSFEEQKSALSKEFHSNNQDLKRNLNRLKKINAQLHSVDKKIFPAKYFEFLKQKKILEHRLAEKMRKRQKLVRQIRTIEKRRSRRFRSVFKSPQKA